MGVRDRIRLTTLRSLAAALAIGAPASACDGDGPGQQPGDAAVDAPVDAAVDAPVDAAPLATGPVTVRVLRPRTPMPPVPLGGVIVFASRADGSIGDRGLTDAAGEATLQVEPGGSVTARVAVEGNSHQLSSILGVEPGDVLTIDPQRELLGSTGPGITYGWPTPPDDDQALAYDAVVVNDGCWHRTLQTFAPDPPLPPLPLAGTVGLVAGCGADPRDVVITHYDTDHLARYAILPGVPAIAGSTVSVAAWSVPDTTFTATATGLLPAIHAYSGLPGPVVNGHWVRGRSRLAVTSAGAATVATPWASAFTSARIWHHVSSDLFGVQSCVEDVPAGARATTLDGAALIPMINTGPVDLVARRVTWTQSSGAAHDEARVDLGYFGPGIQPHVAWSLRASSAVTAVTLPALPADLHALTLQPTFSASATVSLYDLGTIEGWRAMRALSYWVPEVDAVHSSQYGRACRSWD